MMFFIKLGKRIMEVWSALVNWFEVRRMIKHPEKYDLTPEQVEELKNTIKN